jgi:outer membrane receptor protein involved in Fe transport
VGNNPLKYVDPTGNIPIMAALGFGVMTAVASAAGYWIGSGATGTFSWTGLAIATGTGFLAGTMAPLVATKTVGAMILSGTANTVQYVATRIVERQKIDVADAVFSFGVGLVGGRVGRPASQELGRTLRWWVATFGRSTISAGISNMPRPIPSHDTIPQPAFELWPG